MDRNVIFSPEDDQAFEAMCCSIAKEKYADYNAQQYGRSGQKQWGIDIKATDRRHNNEKVVIQCKFKHDPPKFSSTRAKVERKAITDEIEKELNQALNAPGFDFEVFIYSANIPNDKDIEDFAAALEETCGKKIIVWSWDSIQKDILHHPRLTRLYSESKNRLGVEVIDQDFIDGLNEAKHEPSVFHFYTGIQAKKEQWHGILNHWDAPRDCFPDIESQIDFLFSKPYRESKVVAVVYGEGGSGKSTVLRRMAIHAVQNEKPYVVWWVEDLNAFLEFDANSIQSAHKQKHLVIIEDWYRNVGERGKDTTQAKDFFTWLAHCDHVLVLIGDRRKDGFYKDYVFNNKYFKLTGSEHHDILKHMASVSPIFKGILGQFQDNANLINHSSLFVILYIIANISQENATNSQVDIGDIDARFKSIVRKKLSSLESMPEYRGLGRAIHLCAKIYADEYISYFAFSEKALLLTAQYFGKNEEIIDRVESAGEYPIEAKSIFYIKSTY